MPKYAISGSNSAIGSGSSTGANLIATLGVAPGSGQSFWLTGLLFGDTTSTDHTIAVVDATAGGATTATVLMRLQMPCYAITPTGPDRNRMVKFPDPGYKFATGCSAYVVGASGPVLVGTVAVVGYLK